MYKRFYFALVVLLVSKRGRAAAPSSPAPLVCRCCHTWLAWWRVTHQYHIGFGWTNERRRTSGVGARVGFEIRASDDGWAARLGLDLSPKGGGNVRSENEWNGWIYLINRDHCLYTRPREAEGTCPFGMAPSWVGPFVDWPFRDGPFIKGNRLLANLINYYKNWSLI